MMLRHCESELAVEPMGVSGLQRHTLTDKPTPATMFDTANIEDEIRERPKSGERVSARMNLNSKAIIVKRRNSEHGTYGKTLMQTPGPVILTDVEFRVQESAHKSVVEQKSRDVCAYAVGEYVIDRNSGAFRRRITDVAGREGVPVAYNPFRCKYFHIPASEREAGDTHLPVERASKLVLWSEKTPRGIAGRMKALGLSVHTNAL